MVNSTLLHRAGISRRAVLLGMATAVAAPSIVLRFPAQAQSPVSPLASWNEGPAKAAILDFIRTTADRSSANFVAPEDRIATFDQDGTLWVEQPIYTQAVFALDRAHALAPQHPEWQTQDPSRLCLPTTWRP
jgi:hypothetical protein